MKLSLKLLAALVAVSFSLQASAATFIIADGSVAGLKTAITLSNSNGEDDTIELAANSTYTLTAVDNGLNGLPVIGSDSSHKLTVQGSGATIQRSSASGTPAFRILSIGSGAVVTISDLTITNGLVSSFPGGAGIYNDHANLTISSCTISDNSAAPGNRVGGGITNGGSGGGTATLQIVNSTLSGNSSDFAGGGVFNDGESGGSGTLTIINSTLSGNSSAYGGGIDSNGAGGTAKVTLLNSTLSNNSATTGGGGVYNFGATLESGSTIFNTSGIENFNATMTSDGYNLSSDGTGPNNGTTDQINTDPLLGPLQDNGGPTYTHAIGCDSPALDAGSNPNLLTNDQRGPGFARTVGSGTDVGAFELQTACNTAPTITATSGVTIPQDASVSNSSIATVNDAEDAEETLTVTVDGSTSATVNGVTISNIAVDSSGNVTANIAATCGATSASFTLRVTDSGGLYAEATLDVAVTPETTPPVISSVSASPSVLKPPNHTLRLVTVNVTDSDNCDPNPVCNIISVTSNEPDSGCGSGDKPNDIQNINNPPRTVQLRAERCGTGKTGRIYTITVQCTDASGNSATKTTTVTVKK